MKSTSAGRYFFRAAGNTLVQMAVATVPPAALPTLENRFKIEIITAMCLWSEGAIIAISPYRTIVPPEKPRIFES